MVFGVLECWSVGVMQKIFSCEVLFRRSITPLLHGCRHLVSPPKKMTDTATTSGGIILLSYLFIQPLDLETRSIIAQPVQTIRFYQGRFIR
jgi:hypothetical protein